MLFWTQVLLSELADTKIDILVHNAGVLGQIESAHTEEDVLNYQSLGNVRMAAARHAYEVNVLGPLKLTQVLHLHTYTTHNF